MSSKKCMLALGFDPARDGSNISTPHRSAASQALVNNLTYQAFLQQLKWQSFLPASTTAGVGQSPLYANSVSSTTNPIFRQLGCYGAGVGAMNPYLTSGPYFSYQNALLQQAINSVNQSGSSLNTISDRIETNEDTKCDTTISIKKEEPLESPLSTNNDFTSTMKTSPHSTMVKQEKGPSPEDSMSNCSDEWRPLRSRSFLSDDQVLVLQNHFRRNPFPNKYELSALADQINVGKRVVQVWFQV